jgi:hypothetical protein
MTGVDIPACLLGPAIQSCDVSTGAVSPVDSFDTAAGLVDGGGGRATGKPAWNLRSDSTLDGSPG